MKVPVKEAFKRAIKSPNEKCIVCGNEYRHSSHIRYGNDVDNPAKHEFEPESEDVRRCIEQHGYMLLEAGIVDVLRQHVQAQRDAGLADDCIVGADILKQAEEVEI